MLMTGDTRLNLPNQSPDAGRIWAETEETLRLLLARSGRLAARQASTAGRDRNPPPEEASERAAPADLLASRTGKRHERALRALAKEMKRLITEDKRRGLDI